METKLKPKLELDNSSLIEMISQYEKSNMSVAEFCEYNEIEEATFVHWQKRHHKLMNPKGVFRSVEPQVKSAPASIDTLFAEMILPGGIVIRFTSPVDPLFIKALIWYVVPEW